VAALENGNAMQAESQKFLTRHEAQQVLRVSASKLDAEARAGRLRIHRFGRLVRIDTRDLADYIRAAKEVASSR
jgi:excisionase family DNA binding protein